MNTIPFKNFYDYMSNGILSKTQTLLDNNAIDNDIKYRLYQDTGDYLADIVAPHVGNDTLDEVLMNISDAGGVQDSTIAINAYVQIVSIELLAFEYQREDIESILTEFIAEHKSVLTTINGATCNISISNLPNYSGKFLANGAEKFTASFIANIVVFPGAILSNLFELSINGITVKYNSLILDRTTELTADLEHRTTTLFYPNTTGFQITFNGLYVDNSALNTLLSDCSSNARFNQTYNIVLKKYDTDMKTYTTIVNDNFFAKDLQFTLKYGSIVQWQGVFYLGIISGGK